MTEKQKLKVALQLSGHLRTFKQCAPTLYQYLLDKYDVDIFMHTWSTINHNTKTWHQYTYKESNVVEEDVRQVYPQLKALKIEVQQPVDKGCACFKRNYIDPGHEFSIFGMEMQYYGIGQANQLRETYAEKHNVQYDWIVVTRPDIIFNIDVDLEDLVKTESPEDIERALFVFAHPASQVIRDFRNYGGMDLFYFARPKIISDLLNHLPKIAEFYKPNQVYHQLPDYEFIKTVQRREYIIPYRINYQYEKDLDILREKQPRSFQGEPIRKIIRFYIRKIIRFKLCLWKKQVILLWLFPGLLPSILDLQGKLFNCIDIELVVGHSARLELDEYK